MSKAAQAEDAELVSLAYFPFAEGGVSGNPCAEEGRYSFQRKLGRDAERVFFVDHDLGGIAAVGGRLSVLFVAVVGWAEKGVAVLFESFLAALADAAGVDEAAHAGKVADLEVFYMAAYAADTADDLMAGDHGEDGAAPFAADLVDIGVADAAVQDLDDYVVFAGFAAFEGPGAEGCGRALRSVSFSWDHIGSFSLIV